jgi:hypothetical protein
VDRFEDESERSFLRKVSSELSRDETTHKLLDDGLDELGKVQSLVGLAVPDISTENGDNFGIGVGVERVSALVQDVLQLLVVGDDTVVDQAEFRRSVANVRMTVLGAGDTMGSPTSMGHGCLRDEHLVHVNLLGCIPIAVGVGTGEGTGDSLGDVLSERSDFADLLEEDDGGPGRVSINSNTLTSARNQDAEQGLRDDLPALSYPRYSSLARPLHKTSQTYFLSFSTRKEQ